MRRRGTAAASFVGILLALVALWEGYKAFGQATGIEFGVRTNDRAMPHTWDVLASLAQPARRGGEQVLAVDLLQAAWITWQTALVGFLAGGVAGIALGLLLVRSRIAERGLMPYVIASQTVPVLAIAPILITWARRSELPLWIPIAILSGYLAFYPVTIATVRGLRSPDPLMRELMRSYAASTGRRFRLLELPAALPFLFPSLKIAATASVIGAIVGELPAGQSDGLGRQILGFASSFSSAPEKLFASITVAALLGLVFVGVVTLLERLLLTGRQPPATEGGATSPTGSRARALTPRTAEVRS
jgi:NitT/TauT family transport system permease protein